VINIINSDFHIKFLIIHFGALSTKIQAYFTQLFIQNCYH